jgi:heat shock protein HslJ
MRAGASLNQVADDRGNMNRTKIWGLILLAGLLVVNACTSGTDADGTDTFNGSALRGKVWMLVTLEGQETSADPAVTIRFEADGAFGGSDGCNRYRGTASVDGSAIEIIGEMASTRMACAEPVAGRASAFSAALGRVAAFAIEGSRLILLDKGKQEIAIFEEQSLTLSGTAWNVVAYNNSKQAAVSVLGGTKVTARFGEDGRVTGNAGCNNYFAGYEVADESIAIGQPGATRRYCAEPGGVMEQETRYLDALQSAVEFRLEGDKLTLRRVDGAFAVTLLRDDTWPPTAGIQRASKIQFDLDRLNADGLQGPSDGLRALHYEYCIPDSPEAVEAVAAIDPTLEIQQGSPGRVGCIQGELLCLGHTHQPDHLAVLKRLATLAIVDEIHENFFE